MDDAEKAAYVARRNGEPWEMTGLHCWELVRQVQRDVYGRELPEIPGIHAIDVFALARVFNDHEERSRWREVPRPVDGAIVLMGRAGSSTRSRDIHAGVYMAVDRGGILHIDRPHGVAFDGLAELSAIRGWKPSFFIPRDHAEGSHSNDRRPSPG